MQTLSLDNYGVSELSHSEQQETDGGIKLPTPAQLKKAWGYVNAAITAAGIYDAFDDAVAGFQEGWNSVPSK